MGNRLLGFFSGFPSRRFPEEIATRLREEITNRDSLVLISAWPTDYARNDSDATGMHGMFEACGMPFARYCVIDSRKGPGRCHSPCLRRDAGGQRGFHQHGEAFAGHQGIAHSL